MTTYATPHPTTSETIAAPAVRGLAAGSVLAVLGCLIGFLALHLLPGSSRFSPLAAPLSNYELTRQAWLFDYGVLALIAGLVSLLAALIAAREVTGRSPATQLTAGCCLALTVVIAVPYHNRPDGSPTDGGWLHWVAAMLAFGGLAVVPTLLARSHCRRLGCSRLPVLARGLAAGAGGWFMLLLAGSASEFWTSFDAWNLGGLVERVVAGCELAWVLVLAAWLWRGCPCADEPA
jgi:hypothetical protein